MIHRFYYIQRKRISDITKFPFCIMLIRCHKYLLCITKCQVCYRCLMFKYIKHASRIHYGDRTISVEQVGDSLLMV